MFKICAKCKKELPLVAFHKNKRHKDGLSSYCKSCAHLNSLTWRQANKERHNKCKRVYRKNNKDKCRKWAKKSKLSSKYNLSLTAFEDLIVQQNSKCAICGADVKLVIDHCHNTLTIRGLLCTKCNLGLGLFNDDLNLLKNATTYLERFKNGTN